MAHVEVAQRRTWFQTGADPERYELASRRHSLNDSMTVEAVAYVQRVGLGWWFETYPGVHRKGFRVRRASAMRAAESALGLNRCPIEVL